MNEKFMGDLDKLLNKHNLTQAELITHLMLALNERITDEYMIAVLFETADALQSIVNRQAN